MNVDWPTTQMGPVFQILRFPDFGGFPKPLAIARTFPYIGGTVTKQRQSKGDVVLIVEVRLRAELE